MKTTTTSSLAIAVAAALTASSGFAATLFDSQGFEAPTYSLGALTGQNGWLRDGSGIATVQNTVVQSGSQAVSLTGDTTEWHWPDLAYTPVPGGKVVRATTGIQRGSSAAATKNFGYFLDIYTTSPDFARFARAGLGVSGGAPAILATFLGGSGAGNYVLESGLSWDTWYDFRVDLNFDTQKFDVYVNGVLKGADLQFLVPANDLSDVDLMKSYSTGATDIGYFDNYKIEAIPEPTSAAVLLLGLAGLTLARRKA
jgi:hypothetical protein